MLKAYKYRIYPTSEQRLYLAKTFGCTRFIYNKMLADKIEYYKETGEMLKNTPAQYKKELAVLWIKVIKYVNHLNKDFLGDDIFEFV
ncbi:Helix-turn-helix domain-containing protein [Clostridium sp. DSM 8431]|nr:Helix-turn-helix domain-containing protein [Clostridium sp. DSM 8431]